MLGKTVLEEEEDLKLYDNHLLSVCSALGGREEDSSNKSNKSCYVPGDECLSCLRDLKRFLRVAEQDQDRRIHYLLKKWNILQNDLIPLLLISVQKNDLKIATTVCEILVPLTWPFDSKGNVVYSQELKEYQEAFLTDGVFAAILSVMIYIISTPANKRPANESARLKLFALVFRNLLTLNDKQVASTASASEQRLSILQEQLIIKLEAEGVVDFLLSVSGSVSDTEFDGWNTVLVEIFYLIFHTRDIRQMVNKPEKSHVLADMLRLEQQKKQANRRTYSRHTRFGTTFSIALPNGKFVNTTAINSSASTAVKRYQSNIAKIKTKEETSSAYIPVKDPNSAKAMGRIATKLIETSFNQLSNSLKRDIDKERTFITEHDKSRLIWLGHFAMQFRLICKDDAGIHIPLDHIASLFNAASMLYYLRQLREAYEKKKWSLSVLCLNVIDSFFKTVLEMMSSEDDSFKDLGEQLVLALFYENDHLKLIKTMCKDKRIRSNSYLEALIKCVDIIVLITVRSVEENAILTTRKKVRSKANQVTEKGEQEDGFIPQLRKSLFEETLLDPRAFLKDFMADSTLENYSRTLARYTDLTPELLGKIVSFMQRMFTEDPSYFNKLSILELLWSASTFYRKQANRHKNHTLLIDFTTTVFSHCITKIRSDPETVHIIVMRLLFGNDFQGLAVDGSIIRGSDEENDSDEYEEEDDHRFGVGDTEFCKALHSYWNNANVDTAKIKDALIKEIEGALQNAVENDTRMRKNKDATLFESLSEEALGLLNDNDLVIIEGAIQVPLQWTYSELTEGLETIKYLRKPKRALKKSSTNDGSSRSAGRKKAKLNNDPSINDDDDDDEIVDDDIDFDVADIEEQIQDYDIAQNKSVHQRKFVIESDEEDD